MKIDIYTFLFTLTAALVHACGPQSDSATSAALSAPPAQVVPAVPLIPAVAVIQGEPTAAAAPAAPAASGTPASAISGSGVNVVVQTPMSAAQPMRAMAGRKKRSIDLSKMKKCRGIQFDIITEQKETLRNASEIIENLRSKIKSMQKKFINTMNSMKLESQAGGDKMKMSYKVDAECDAVRHIILDTLVQIETIHMIVTKCDCQNSFIVFKKDFQEE